MDGDAIIGNRTGEDHGDIKNSALDMLYVRCLLDGKARMKSRQVDI